MLKIENEPPSFIDTKYINLIISILNQAVKDFSKDNEIMQYCVLLKENSKIEIVPMIFRNDYEKAMISKILQHIHICIDKKPDFVIAVLDIWMSIKTAIEYQYSKDYVRPADDPNRKEALAVSIIFPDGTMGGLMAVYERKNGKPIFDIARWTDKDSLGQSGLIKPWRKIVMHA